MFMTMLYNIQLWDLAKKSNIFTLQSLQLINLRIMTGASLYINNYTLHKDLRIQTFSELASSYFKKCHSGIRNLPNSLISNLHNPTNPTHPLRRLKRKWAKDLLQFNILALYITAFYFFFPSFRF